MRAFGPLVVAVSLLAAGGPSSVFAQTDQAASVLAAARAALGGDARIAAVRTFVATGRTRQVRGNNLVPIEFEIQAELPDKYSRRDEVPAQDTGPTTIGFNGNALLQEPTPPAAGRAGAPPPPAAQQDAARRARVDAVKHDFARLILGMFATSFSSVPLTFAYVARAEAPQGSADVIDVKGPANFAGRLFIDSQTHLPLMMTWQGGGAPQGPPVDQRMYFADYREVDGLRLPFRVRRAAGAETTEETTFDRFRINARIDPRKFDTGN